MRSLREKKKTHRIPDSLLRLRLCFRNLQDLSQQHDRSRSSEKGSSYSRRSSRRRLSEKRMRKIRSRAAQSAGGRAHLADRRMLNEGLMRDQRERSGEFTIMAVMRHTFRVFIINHLQGILSRLKTGCFLMNIIPFNALAMAELIVNIPKVAKIMRFSPIRNQGA
jgi:hypothetical protein